MQPMTAAAAAAPLLVRWQIVMAALAALAGWRRQLLWTLRSWRLSAQLAVQPRCCVWVHSSFVATLPAALQAAALRLSAALPHRFACNNPGCTNLAGASEAALVGGKGCICAGCRTARYCGAKCKLMHWPHHKPVCRRLKREAAAAMAAADAVA